MKILILDDSLDALDLLAMKLEDEGHTVLTFSDQMKALDALTEGKVDLIITDLEMPGMDGYKFSEAARLISKAPIVLHTGHISPERRFPISSVVEKLDFESLKKEVRKVELSTWPVDRSCDI